MTGWNVNAADAATDVPQVSINPMPNFISDPEITITGHASYAAGIKWTWYDWYDNNRIRAEGYLDTPQATEVPMEKHISLDVDGKHWFRFYVKAENGQEVWGDWTWTMLDKTAPKIADRTQTDGILEADTVLRINVTDQDPSGGNDASGIASVTMQVTDKNNREYGPIDLVRQESGMVREEGRIHSADYTAALGNIFAQLPEGNINIKFSTKDNLGNENHEQVLVYKKPEPPVVSMSVPAEVTNQAQVALGIKVDADYPIKKIWLESGTIKGNKKTDFPRAEIDFPRGKNVNFNHPYTFPSGDGKYFFRLVAEDERGQQTGMRTEESVYVVYDTVAPELSEVFPAEGSKIQYGIDMKFKVDDRDGSGINDVQIRLCRGDNCSGWYENVEKYDGLYMRKLRTKEFGNGELTATIWIKDNAGNITSRDVKYVKDVPTQQTFYFSTTSKSRDISFGFSAVENSTDARIELWKDGAPDAKQILNLNADLSKKVSGSITVSEDGVYYWVAIDAHNSRMAGPTRLAVSTGGPEIRGPKLEPGALNGESFEMRVSALSKVDIADVQLQACQGKRCAPWITDLKIRERGRYLGVVPVGDIAGSFSVHIWAKDEVGRSVQGPLTYYRPVKAETALAISLERGVADATDWPKERRIGKHEQVIYRIALSIDRYFLDDATLRYRLPGGMRPDGIPKLIAGEAEIK